MAVNNIQVITVADYAVLCAVLCYADNLAEVECWTSPTAKITDFCLSHINVSNTGQEKPKEE